MKTFWITGARGFIGRHLARNLALSGNRVCGLGHGAWPEIESNLWGISYWLNAEVSISSLAQLKAKLGKPHGIFHFAGGSSVGAAISNPHEDFKRTVGATAELLEWIRQYSINTPLVAASSAAVYGAGHEGPISENDKLSPYSPYGTHKLMMEELCSSYAENFGLRVALPRLFSVYGPELKKQLLWDICNKLEIKNEIALGGNGSEMRDWIYVGDVVATLANLIESCSKKSLILNIATSTATSVRDVATLVAQKWSPEKSIKISFSGESRTGDPQNLIGDIKKLQDLGFACGTTFDQGISEYVAWFRTLGSRA